MSEGIRISFDLVSLIQLNLVRRRLATLAHGEAFVHPDDIKRVLSILDDHVLGEDFESKLHILRSSHGR